MNIVVRKSKDLLPSNFEIVVDGVRWGRLVRENMSTFRVQQEGSNRVVRHSQPHGTGSPVTLTSQAVYERHHRPDHGPLLTFEERAGTMIMNLIDAQKLIDPASARSEREAEEAEIARRVIENKAIERERFEGRARDVLREVKAEQSPDNVALMVKAMRDAQSW